MKVIVAVLIACLPTFVSANPPARKKVGPSVTDLQSQIIDLQKELADCKALAADTAAKVNTEADRRAGQDLAKQKMAPIVEAIKSLRAAHSVASGGSVMDFKQYYLDAKVKVESLPASPEASMLGPVLEAYSDANTVLLLGLRAGVGSFEPSVWQNMSARYPGITIGSVQVNWSHVTIVQGLREGGINLINEGYRRLQLVEDQLAKAP